MMFAVQILFDGEWTTLTARFRTRTDAEWAIAKWRQGNGSNGRDTGFRVADMSLADCFVPSLLAAITAIFTPEDWQRYEGSPLADRIHVELIVTREELLALRAAIAKAEGGK